jgi:hypothetical protein
MERYCVKYARMKFINYQQIENIVNVKMGIRWLHKLINVYLKIQLVIVKYINLNKSAKNAKKHIYYNN